MIDSPLGRLTALSDGTSLIELAFLEASKEEDSSPLLESFAEELALYFEGKLRQFKTPLKPKGTPFQLATWSILQTIPFGTTISYSTLAAKVGKPTAYRAVALANNQNPLPIIIPCHRVIYKDGSLGGYAGGITIKQRLLDHENPLFR